jgi:predicted DNA-binding transcriptional regulator YafY
MPNPFSNLVKLVSAVSLLAAPGGTTIKTLMAKLSLSKRSVFRLLEALGDLGFPIVDERRDLSTEKV